MTDYKQINALAAEALQLWGAGSAPFSCGSPKRTELIERLGAVLAAKGDPASR